MTTDQKTILYFCATIKVEQYLSDQKQFWSYSPKTLNIKVPLADWNKWKYINKQQYLHKYGFLLKICDDHR